jgi:hypothetical protein
MGGLTYLFGFIINSILASIVAGAIALVVAIFPKRSGSDGHRQRSFNARRATFVFIAAWLLLMIYGCVEMFRAHHDEMSKAEGARMVVGLIDREDQVLHAERIAQADSAQSYLMVQSSTADVQRFAQARNMRPSDYDGHTADARGWQVPTWWPTTACRGGTTYNSNPADRSPGNWSYVVNWCPAQKLAYVQHFDY